MGKRVADVRGGEIAGADSGATGAAAKLVLMTSKSLLEHESEPGPVTAAAAPVVPAKKEIRYADLPLVSVLKDTSEVELASQRLQELDALQQLIDNYTERQTELKDELAKQQKEAGVDGLRFGDLCFVERTMPGRESLDRQKLMEVAGVTARQLQECTKSGKPYEQRTFKNLLRKPAEKPVESDS